MKFRLSISNFNDMRLRRLIVFLFLLLIAQSITGYFVFLRTSPEIVRFRSYLKDENNILFFGDSVIHEFGPTDTDHSTIAQMLEKFNPPGSVKDLSHGAYEMRVFDAYLSNIARSGQHPKAIIIPINLRAYSPVKDREPVYQFAKETFILTTQIPFIEYFYRPLAIFRAINLYPISTEEYLATPLYWGDKLVGHISDYARIDATYKNPTYDDIRDFMIYEHLYPLKPDDRNIIALEDIAQTARAHNLNVVFYVTPIDYQHGDRYVGKVFGETIKSDAQMLCDIVKAHDLPCLDLSTALTSNYFIDSVYINVHLKEAGRAFVAQKVYDAFFKGRP